MKSNYYYCRVILADMDRLIDTVVNPFDYCESYYSLCTEVHKNSPDAFVRLTIRPIQLWSVVRLIVMNFVSGLAKAKNI